MNARIAILTMGLVAAAGAIVVLLLGNRGSDGGDEGPPPTLVTDADRPVAEGRSRDLPAPAPGMPAADDAPSAEEFARLEARVAALEELVATLSAERTTADPEEERRFLARLGDAELAAHANSLQKSEAPARARTAWRMLLDRHPSPEVRDEALFSLGVLERELGDHAASEKAFRELIDLAGPGTARAAEARYQVSWTYGEMKDLERAVNEMESVANDPAAPATLRGHARTNGAHFALSAGDPERARRLLDQAITDLAESKDPMHQWIVGRAKEMLAGLDGTSPTGD